VDIEGALRQIVAEVVRDEVRRALRDELPAILREALATHVPSPDDDRYLDANEAANLVGVAPTTIRRWAYRGQLKACRAGRLLRVRLRDLRECVEREPPEEGVDIDKRVEEILRKMNSAGPRKRRRGR
jgi:excisionase family DNA binding protein